ncbi:alpha/beta hydrolase [Micromonospora sp. WMMD812]|uniref:alpha/beta fold hydrolase n=1 Tax=Micromonospora sp. WMMD812 TaxID=3015152 RepID=UPI00248BFECE|nr:alpha/beta hydrolase [Micromonospora sp. WMMD812]WBB70101.1 alpha/beta hydrolase [Micromonospora sp. WMMD812]
MSEMSPPHSRRKFLSTSAAAIGAATAGSFGLLSASAAEAEPRRGWPAGGGVTGLGGVSQAPHLPPGFTKTFTSRFVHANGLRQHVVIGGDGPPLLLVHGWPETWYAWRLLMPALAKDFTVIAVDQRGIGLTDKPQDGYDSATLANDLVALMDALGHQRFAVVGHDTGMPIAYALAADHPQRVDRFVVAEAPLPGVSDSPPVFGSPAWLNDRVWHIGFNRLTEVNELLVRGREDIFFGYEFEINAKKKLPDHAVRYYIRLLASHRDALRGSFNLYRALDTTLAQNVERQKAGRLTIPVLAVGGAASIADGAGTTMERVADDVQTLVIPDCGHWVAEEAPEEMLTALTAFLAPYRERR